VSGFRVLPIPPRASGEGILSVNAVPWGRVLLNGHAVADTPVDLRLRAGRYRVRIERRAAPPAEQLVTVKPGARTTFFP
jgi:hypothetical protein